MPQCAVRHLRVAAASEPAARRFVTTLEDALRCATLPGDDRRVVVVRRLALGRVAHDAGTQRLVLLIEQRLARGDIAWADIDEPPDPRADAVGFAGALEARVQLARRLARGASCDAWYWPLAVPEFRRADTPREALRRIAQALAALPEARVALTAWIAQVVDAGGAAILQAAIDEHTARSLLRDAGIALPADEGEGYATRPPARASADTQPGARVRDVVSSSASTLPRWLNVVLARAQVGEQDHATRLSPRERHDSTSCEPSTSGATMAAMTTADSSALVAPASTTAMKLVPTTSEDPAQTRHAQAPPSHVANGSPSQIRAPVPSMTSDGDWHPTACGGLLFLLPVLARAGLVQGDSPDDDRAAAQRVLRAALRRVHAEADDAAWSLMADLPVPRPSESNAAKERTHRELAAARRWLYRHARLGLVALVRRPARLAFTATHIDVRFPLAGADIRLRRIGLDVDPGWLPWFGRVIAFQFAGRLP